MKKILAMTLTFVILLASMTSCVASQKPSEAEGEQTTTQSVSETETKQTSSQYLTNENGAYKLTLPKCKDVIKLDDDKARFVPYITNALVEAAENKITDDVSHYSNHSGFFLQVTDNYLCLVVEVIIDIDPTVSTKEGEFEVGGCGFDHEHLFFSERISSQGVIGD